MRWTSATEMEWNVIKPNARQKSYKIGCFRTDEVQSLLEIAVHENWSNTIFLVLSSQDYFGWFHPNNPNVTQSQSLDTLLLLLLLALVFSWTKFFLSGPYLIYFFLHHIKLQLFCVFLLLIPFAALSYAEWFDVLLPFFSILFFFSTRNYILKWYRVRESLRRSWWNSCAHNCFDFYYSSIFLSLCETLFVSSSV